MYQEVADLEFKNRVFFVFFFSLLKITNSPQSRELDILRLAFLSNRRNWRGPNIHIHQLADGEHQIMGLPMWTITPPSNPPSSHYPLDLIFLLLVYQLISDQHKFQIALALGAREWRQLKYVCE